MIDKIKKWVEERSQHEFLRFNKSEIFTFLTSLEERCEYRKDKSKLFYYLTSCERKIAYNADGQKFCPHCGKEIRWEG